MTVSNSVFFRHLSLNVINFKQKLLFFFNMLLNFTHKTAFVNSIPLSKMKESTVLVQIYVLCSGVFSKKSNLYDRFLYPVLWLVSHFEKVSRWKKKTVLNEQKFRCNQSGHHMEIKLNTVEGNCCPLYLVWVVSNTRQFCFAGLNNLFTVENKVKDGIWLFDKLGFHRSHKCRTTWRFLMLISGNNSPVVYINIMASKSLTYVTTDR